MISVVHRPSKKGWDKKTWIINPSNDNDSIWNINVDYCIVHDVKMY